MALALLKLHEPLLLAQDNEGELLRVTRRLAAEAYDRDALMKVGRVRERPSVPACTTLSRSVAKQPCSPGRLAASRWLQLQLVQCSL